MDAADFLFTTTSKFGNFWYHGTDVAGLFSVENLGHHKPAKPPKLNIVGHRGYGTAVNAACLAGKNRRLGVLADLDDCLERRDDGGVVWYVNGIDLADEPARSEYDIVGGRRHRFYDLDFEGRSLLLDPAERGNGAVQSWIVDESEPPELGNNFTKELELFPDGR